MTKLKRRRSKLSKTMAVRFGMAMRQHKSIDLHFIAKKINVPWKNVVHDLDFDSNVKKEIKKVLHEFKYELAQTVYKNTFDDPRKVPSPTGVKFIMEMLSTDMLFEKAAGDKDKKDPTDTEHDVDPTNLKL